MVFVLKVTTILETFVFANLDGVKKLAINAYLIGNVQIKVLGTNHPFITLAKELDGWPGGSRKWSLLLPNEAFIETPNFLGLGRHIGQVNFGVFGKFSAKLKVS